MKPVWKWIIGVVVGLIVVAAVVGAVFLVRAHLPLRTVTAFRLPAPNTVPGPRSTLPTPAPGTRQVPPGNFNRRFGTPYNGMPYPNFPGYGYHRYGMMGFGPMMFLMPFGGLVFGLFWAGLLALLVIGIVWLVQRPRAGPQPTVPPQPPALTSQRTCQRCGRSVQDDWNNCPYCGKKL
jgi:hypothetical protein